MIRVAVFFGGVSPEHDVSVITALQVIEALDPTEYEVTPVYIDPAGRWYTGEQLLERSSYIPSRELYDRLTPVNLNLGNRNQPTLLAAQKRWLGVKLVEIPFDVALPAFHGLVGEDGQIQGVFETAHVPYAGPRVLDGSVTMNKVATKRLCAAYDVPMLDFRLIERPTKGRIIAKPELEKIIDGMAFPLCLKPVNLGSSIGVAKVAGVDELASVLPTIFAMDHQAMVEPFVENMFEVNVAVRRRGGEVLLSALEVPKQSGDLLDFKVKYRSGSGDSKLGDGGPKLNRPSEGLLSLTRDINPDIGDEKADWVKEMAVRVFECTQATGVPRLDFIGNSETGELWFNELNPIPGSFGYFLWEAAPNQPVSFSQLLDDLLAEAIHWGTVKQLPADATPVEARLFDRH